MTFEYQLTLDEVREGLRPVRPDGRPDKRAGRGLLGWVVFTALALSLVYLLTLNRTTVTAPPGVATSAPAATAGGDGAGRQNLWDTLTPTLVPAGVAVVATLAAVARQRSQTRRAMTAIAAGRPVPRPPTTVPKWLTYVVISPLALVLLPNIPALAVPWSPTSGTALWVAFAPWIGTAVVLSWVGKSAARRAADRVWVTTPAARLPTVMDVSTDGVRTVNASSETLYRWAMVARYRETANLLVLALDDGRSLLVPKRAVPDGPAEDELRGLIHTHVAEGTFLPRQAAFAVLPVMPLP